MYIHVYVFIICFSFYSESAQLEAVRRSHEQQVSELRKDKVLAENQLEVEKLRADSERKKVALAHEQLRDKVRFLNAPDYM